MTIPKNSILSSQPDKTISSPRYLTRTSTTGTDLSVWQKTPFFRNAASERKITQLTSETRESTEVKDWNRPLPQISINDGIESFSPPAFLGKL